MSHPKIGESYAKYEERMNRRASISLPAATWRQIERELRERGCWWLANQLVNTGSPVFSAGERSND